MLRPSVLALLALVARCKDHATPPSIDHSPPPARCTLRISPKGIFVDGDPKSRAEAIAACKGRAGAVVVLEDNAPADDWAALQKGLRAAGVRVYTRGVVDDKTCLDNPLAHGCS